MDASAPLRTAGICTPHAAEYASTLFRPMVLAGNVSTDPTPDLLATSPNGSHVFMSLRGPNPLTADPHVSTGSTPGVGVIKIQEGGSSGTFEAFAPVTNVDGGGVERADIHALTIRYKPGRPD